MHLSTLQAAWTVSSHKRKFILEISGFRLWAYSADLEGLSCSRLNYCCGLTALMYAMFVAFRIWFIYPASKYA